MTTTTNNAKRTTVENGTLVVNKTDGESGRVIRVATYRRNGIGAWSYLVETAYGVETWHAGDVIACE